MKKYIHLLGLWIILLSWGIVSAATAGADLVVDINSLIVTPGTVKSGDKIKIELTVQNSGTASASNFKTKFYLNEQLVFTKTTSLSAGHSSKISTSVKTPVGWSGTATIRAVVDATSLISEDNEGNNEVLTTILVQPPQIDLAVRPADLSFAPTTPKPGEAVKISANLHNWGNTTATKVKSVIVVNGTRVQEKTGLTLSAGGEKKIEYRYAIPKSLLGNLDVKVVLDPGATIADIDRSNNTATGTILLNPLNIDLALTPESLTISPATPIIAGRKFKVTGTISNIGRDKADPTTLGISLVTTVPVKTDAVPKESDLWLRAKGGTLLLEDLLRERAQIEEKKTATTEVGTERRLIQLGTVNTPSLNPGKSINFTKELTLPADYQLPSAELQLTVNLNRTVYEVNQANNLAIITLPTSPQTFDVAVTNANITHTPHKTPIMAGKNVTLRTTVNNIGTEKLTNLKVNFYFNTQASLTGAQWVASKTITSLTAGKSYTLSTPLTIPATAATHQLVLVVADPENKLIEVNEKNNLAVHTVPVTAQTRDLAVEFIKPSPLSPTVGQNVTWQIKVKNYGNTAADNVTLGLYTDLNSAQPTVTKSWNKIASQATASTAVSWTVPNDLPFAVNYPVKVVVDYQNQITESNEENNQQIYGLTIKAPELSLLDNEVFAYPNTIYQGESFSVRGLVHNITLPVNNVKVRLNYALAGTNTTWSKLVESDLGPITKGQTKDFYLAARLPATIPVGTNVLLAVVVDPDQAILETNESNNVITIPRTVTTPPRRVQFPTLTVSVRDENDTAKNGVTVTLKNTATGAIESKMTGSEDFYYSVGNVIFESRPTTATYQLTISAPGYRSQTRTINYQSSDDNYYEFVLDKNSVVSGQITSYGSPLAGVKVSVPFTSYLAQTNSQGYYELLLPAGTYSFKYLKDGYSRIVTSPVSVTAATSLTLNQTMTATVLGYLNFYITNDDGVGLPQVEIKNDTTTLGYTDSSGRFSTTANGLVKLKFSKSSSTASDNYVGVEMPPLTILAGQEQNFELSMYHPSTGSHTERGTTFVSWHQHVGTPANAFWIPEYNVDVWWGLGKIKMALDYSQSASGTKASQLLVRVTGDEWECHQVTGEGEIETSAIDIPLTIAAGGCDTPKTQADVYKVAIVSNGEEIWSDDTYWTTATDPLNVTVKTYNLNNLDIDWNNDFKVKLWFRVQERSGISALTEGEGSGALGGYYLDRKLVSWFPKKPPTTTVSTSLDQVGNYFLSILDNPVNAIANFSDLYSVEEYNQYTMEEVLPSDFPF